MVRLWKHRRSGHSHAPRCDRLHHVVVATRPHARRVLVLVLVVVVMVSRHRPGRQPFLPFHRAAAVGVGVVGHQVHRDLDGERRADAGRAVDVDAAAHQLQQLLGDEEAQAGPAVGDVRVRGRLSERHKQQCPLLGGHADARVVHGHDDGVAPGLGIGVAGQVDPRLDDHLARRRQPRKLDGVGEQVDDDLRDALDVATQRHAGLVRGVSVRELHVVRERLGLEHAHNVADQLLHAKARFLQDGPAQAKPRQV